ncbi:unnamed protein product, partial [Rotaria sp. Silwood1]
QIKNIKNEKIIIFVKSNVRSGVLRRNLSGNFSAIEINLGVAEEERQQRYEEFKIFSTTILITTDLYEDNVNFENVNIIINYDMPADADTYLFRVARAGGLDKNGLVITFITNQNEMAILNNVKSHLKVQITEMPDDIDVATLENH